MAKNFPFFKFIATEWMTGNIAFESLGAQGLFINICALYWQRDCVLQYDEIVKRYKNPVELKELKGNYFSLNGDGTISIKFLDEQFSETRKVSVARSISGKKGADARNKDFETTSDIKTQSVPHNLNLKQSKIEFFFHDFPNSQELDRVSMALKVSKDVLLKFLPEFRKFAQLDYPNMVKFAEHFKNWYLKQSKNIELTNPKTTTVVFGAKKR